MEHKSLLSVCYYTEVVSQSFYCLSAAITAANTYTHTHTQRKRRRVERAERARARELEV